MSSVQKETPPKIRYISDQVFAEMNETVVLVDIKFVPDWTG